MLQPCSVCHGSSCTCGLYQFVIFEIVLAATRIELIFDFLSSSLGSSYGKKTSYQAYPSDFFKNFKKDQKSF